MRRELGPSNHALTYINGYIQCLLDEKIITAKEEEMLSLVHGNTENDSGPARYEIRRGKLIDLEAIDYGD